MESIDRVRPIATKGMSRQTGHKGVNNVRGVR